jgi:DNA-binding protein YbaB
MAQVAQQMQNSTEEMQEEGAEETEVSSDWFFGFVS